MLMSGSMALFEIETTFEYEIRVRDEDGWLEGRGPGNGKFYEGYKTFRVVAGCQEMAEAWVRATLKRPSEGTRNVVLKETRRVSIDRVIIENQP